MVILVFWEVRRWKFQNLPSQFQISPKHTCSFASLIYQGLFYLHYMRKWDEWPMEVVFTQLPMSPGVSDSHSSRCGFSPYIHVSTLSQFAAGTSVEQTHHFLLCAHHPKQGSMLPVSPGISRTLPDCCPQHTQRNIHLMERPDTSQKLLSLFPTSQGIILVLKTQRLHSKSPSTLLHASLQPPYKTAQGCKWKKSQSMGTDARRGHTHQSVHSLHRTPAPQAVRSSCSC